MSLMRARAGRIERVAAVSEVEVMAGGDDDVVGVQSAPEGEESDDEGEDGDDGEGEEIGDQGNTHQEKETGLTGGRDHNEICNDTEDDVDQGSDGFYLDHPSHSLAHFLLEAFDVAQGETRCGQRTHNGLDGAGGFWKDLIEIRR